MKYEDRVDDVFHEYKRAYPRLAHEPSSPLTDRRVNK